MLAVEVLHLMTSAGAYATSVSDMLAGSEVWQAYKHQKHDLFLPAAGDRSVSSCKLLQCWLPCCTQKLLQHWAPCVGSPVMLWGVHAHLIPHL